MEEQEIWKDIVGYGGRYKISTSGRVLFTGNYLGNKRKSRPRLVKTRKNAFGYATVCLYTRNIGKTHMVHRLIAEAFIPNPNSKKYIDHINTIRDDNRIENLRWVSAKENCNNQLTREHIKESSKKAFNNPKVRKERSERMKRINDIVVEKRRKKVTQYSVDGTFVAEYKSLRCAAKSVGGYVNYISHVCKGIRESYKGFIWKYKE